MTEENLEVVERLLKLVANDGSITQTNYLIRCAILLTVFAPEKSPFKTITEISDYFNRSESSIYQIASLMGYIKPQNVYPLLRSPQGERVEITNLRKFAQDNNLNYNLISHVIKGTRYNHKGWCLYESVTPKE